jgi:7-carboxy-7-deazaguanine synthase
MAFYEVVEHFISINGEGTRAGQLALFIRLKGCNLCCKYCDTKWANEADCKADIFTEEDLEKLVIESKVRNVTITGGEPLYRDDMDILLNRLSKIPNITIEIETNGSVDLSKYRMDNVSFTMDYKLSCSGMEDKMHTENFKYLGKNDTVKFVIGSHADLIRAKEVIEEYNLIDKTAIYFSPVFGDITPKEIVEFMIENNLNGVNFQLQLHKYIWNPDERGV